MMREKVIRAQGLGKRYRVGANQGYKTFREVLTQLVARPRQSADDIWALRDASFEVEQGEVLGVIGRNGAGKSTLLKILARITEPTEGIAQIRGRVGSLLEVGTGFHPELSGRENIYLNGAILGMRRAEITRKFDDIVAFAGVEKFIDTPVKRYSSGMYVRLAFAVAAHLQTEVLLVDEVIAVGDVAFQMKCLKKMSEVSGSGKTILFVSHNMEAVIKLCTRGILLEGGRIAKMGSPSECVEHYLFTERDKRTALGNTVLDLKNHPGRTKQLHGPVRLTSLQLRDADGETTWNVQCGKMFTAVLGYELTVGSGQHGVTFSITFSNIYNHRIASCRSHDTHLNSIQVTKSGQVICRVLRLPLVPGFYRISLGCSTDAGFSDGLYDVAVIEVTGNDFYPSKSLPSRTQGEVLFDHEWELSSAREGVIVNGAPLHTSPTNYQVKE